MIINLSRIDFGGVTGGKSKPEEVFDVQPTTTDQTITPSEGSVFSGGTVRAVTKEIDVNIVSNNIKEGVTILGVAGNLKEEKPEESFNVQPTTAEQTITPTAGSVFSGGTVKAVTSAIDNNIVAGNIKEGVTILGVAGALKGEKPEESFNVQPTTAEQTITPTAGSVFSGGTVRAVTSSIDSNIQPENIKQGVSILGVAGTLVEGITPAGTIAINLNGTYDVTNYASAEVNVGDTPDYHYMNGTVDRAGLKAIGWTDEDILTYEQNSPHYPGQNDQFIVSDENKALYLLDDPNPSSYKDNPNITFVPKKNMESYFAKSSAFSGMKYIKGIPRLDTSNMTNAYGMFRLCSKLTTIPPLVTSNITDASDMFYGCSKLEIVPQIDLSKATDVSHMFAYCYSLTTIPALNLSNATDLEGLFIDCNSLKTVPALNLSSATSVYNLFYNCSNLTTIPELNLSSRVIAGNMFGNCTRLITVPELNLSSVIEAQNMFYGCSELETVSSLNLSNATDLEGLFYGCSKLKTVSQLLTPSATNINKIFSGCERLKTVEGIDFSGLTSSPSLFGWSSGSSVTRFIVNGKINVSISGNYGIKALKNIDYDSVKSILAAADRTDNTNAKELAFNRTMTDQNGELAALVSSCTSKGWTITGLTLQ